MMLDRPLKIDPKKLEAYIRKDRKRFEEILGRFVEIPSVSMDPGRRRDIHHMAEEAVKTLREMGAVGRRIGTRGNPVIFGRFSVNPRYPTVTLYNHLDVQPADEPEWLRPPFQFEIQGERYLGRGATDDKGPAITALLAARYAVENKIPLNIQFIWELEEEIGSPHFGEFIRKTRRDCRTDSILVSDTIWLAKGRPAIPYGLRGLVSARLVLETGQKEAHSGLTGGAARNPIAELCQVIAVCHDAKTGRVKVPGFYDDLLRADRQEMRGFAESGFSVGRFRKAHGLRRLRSNDRIEVMRRIWTEPTFEVHGISGGYQGPGVKTAIPPWAEAKISMRLVPNQDPQKIISRLRRFVKKVNPDVRVFPEGCLEPYLGPSDGPYAQAAREAVRYAFEREPVLVREGGAIGAVVSMKRTLKAPIVFIGLSLPEHGYHAPNEYFDWGQAAGGVKAFVRYFSRIAEIPKEGH
ncbi:MAG: M20/M25/M40 family metallo-hydrolase [Nitrospiria bacterium]